MSREYRPIKIDEKEIFKTECIYRVKLKTYEEASLLISQYIDFYNNQLIHLKTKLTPSELRSQYVA